MGLMELELAQLEYRLRTAEADRRHALQRKRRERSGADQAPGPERATIDWPVMVLRLGPLRLALFRTVRLRVPGLASDSHGTSRLLPG